MPPGRRIKRCPIEDDFPAVLLPADLADDGVDVAEAALRQPTLDEVFLRLTGSPASENEASDEEAADDGTAAENREEVVA